MVGKCALSCHCCGNGIAGSGKGYEEGIALSIDLVAIKREERATYQRLACFQERSVALTEQLEELR
jgi:hypothetical protein